MQAKKVKVASCQADRRLLPRPAATSGAVVGVKKESEGLTDGY